MIINALYICADLMYSSLIFNGLYAFSRNFAQFLKTSA